MTTSELYEAINDRICLSPSAQYYLKDYLRYLDGEQLINDIEPDDDDSEE